MHPDTFVFLFIVFLFYIFTPGILITLPSKTSSKYIIHLIHSILFATILTLYFHMDVKENIVSGFGHVRQIEING